MKSLVLGVICKLDIEKAYDRMNWESLLDLDGALESNGVGGFTLASPQFSFLFW